MIDSLGYRISQKLKWKKGEWHHVVITWKDKGNGKYECAMYAGKLLQKAEFSVKKDVLNNAKKIDVLIFGNRRRCYASINEVRILSRALTEKEVKSQARKQLKKDKDALLLLTGSDFQKMKKVKTKLTTSEYENSYAPSPKLDKKGQIVGYYEFVRGKYGKAIKLSDYDKRKH